MILLRNYRAYGANLNSNDVWKFTAIALMVVDHVGYFFCPYDVWLRVAGRLCVPMWFFFVGHSRSQRVTWDMVALAAVLIAGDAWVGAPIFSTNILVTIIVCRLLNRWVVYRFVGNSCAWRLYATVVAMLALYWATEKVFEYGTLAVIMSLCGYLTSQGRRGGAAAVYYGIAGSIFVGLQVHKFAFDRWESAALAVGTGVVLLLLFHYRLTTVSSRTRLPSVVAVPVKFIARNSLYFYAAHFLAFLLVDALFSPYQYGPFRWF